MRSQFGCPRSSPAQQRLRPRIFSYKTIASLQQLRKFLRTKPLAAHSENDPSLGAHALLVSTLYSCALCLTLSLPSSAADGVTIKFPASRDPEIRSAQQVLVQAWGYVREYYVDGSFNKQDWTKKLQEALAATFRATSHDEAMSQVEMMLASLGDPFTRVLLPGGASEAFQAMTQAKIVSTGLQVGRLGDPDGPLLVSYVIEGSPAAEAGLREGDEVVAVNGQPVWALHGRDAAPLQDLLRQNVEVQLKLLRSLRVGAGGAATSERSGTRWAAVAAAAASPSSLPPLHVFSSDSDSKFSPVNKDAADDVSDKGDGGSIRATIISESEGTVEALAGTTKISTAIRASEELSAPSTSYPLPGSFFNVVLRPAPVEFVPVQYAVLGKELPSNKARGGAGNGLKPAPSTSLVGYIRIVAFTDNVADEVASSIRALQAAGCGSWLIDVRGNPGGIVREGLHVAELLMPPGQVFAWVADRSGMEYAEQLSESAQALVVGQPLAVLVDRYSASTSELLAGALHDDVRAILVGERTYGKGRTQQVVQLYGGATLLVSTDTYVTPARRTVDKVGLSPDLACRSGPPPLPVLRPTPRAATAAGSASVRTEATGSSNDGSVGKDFGEGGLDGEPTIGGNSSSIQRVNNGAGGSSSGIGTGSSLAREQVDLLTRDKCVRAAINKLMRAS